MLVRNNTWAHLSLQKPFLQQNQLTRPCIRAVRRLLPAKGSHHSVCVSHHQLAAPISICRHAHAALKKSQKSTFITEEFSENLPISLMRMTLVLAGMCWVRKGFWSSGDWNSCWLDESALLVAAAVRSKRWNQPSAPTATTKFWHRKNKNTPSHQILNLQTICSFWLLCSHLSFVAHISNSNAGQLGKHNTPHEPQITWHKRIFLAPALTMPTQDLVIQGLESSFL